MAAVTTLTAGVQKIFHADPTHRFRRAGEQVQRSRGEGHVLAPAKSIEEMRRVAFNNYLDAVVCGIVCPAGHCDVCFCGKDLPAGVEASESDSTRNTASRTCTRSDGMKALELDTLTADRVAPQAGRTTLAYRRQSCSKGCAAFARFAGRCSAFRTTRVTSRTRRRIIRMRQFCRGAIFARRRSSTSTGKAGRAAVRTTFGGRRQVVEKTLARRRAIRQCVPSSEHATRHTSGGLRPRLIPAGFGASACGRISALMQIRAGSISPNFATAVHPGA